MRLSPIAGCLLVLICCMPVQAGTKHFPPWGSSISSVLRWRTPSSFTGEKIESLLFSLPVYAVLIEENVNGHPASVVYSFFEGALLERLISFHGDKKELYGSIKADLQENCLPYSGPYFPEIDDAFISINGSTLYLLLSGSEVMLYVLDAEAYDAHRKKLNDATEQP